MRRIIYLLLMMMSLPVWAETSSSRDSLERVLRELDYVLERRDTYFMAHEHRIDSLKRVYAQLGPTATPTQRFDALNRVYDAYQSFQNDSARVYANKEREIAEQSADAALKVRWRRDDLFTYMSRGDFTNAVETFRNTDFTGVPDSIKADYYTLVVRLYSDLSNFTSEKWEDKYAMQSRAYADTVLKYAKPGSYSAQFASNFLSGYSVNRQDKIGTYLSIVSRGDVPADVKAMNYSILGDLYMQNGQPELGLTMKAKSAILDIQTAKRETTSKQFLANELFTLGDVDRASRYIHAALEEAEAYNAPQRKAEIGRTLSLIEAQRYSSVDTQRRYLWIVTAVIVVIALLILWFFLYIRKQNRKLRESQRIIKGKNEEIEAQNRKLSQLNSDLRDLNMKIRESVKIKDEYIGYALYLNSEYIERIKGIYKFIQIKAKLGHYEDIKNSLKSGDLKEEKEKMLTEFDKIFLKLFPTFREQYNALFPAGEPLPTDGEEGILTPEMRIFALIRLGVTDGNKIARFLNYSINTINTYKTKAKNRSVVPNEEFESRIMQIKSVPSGATDI